MGCGFVYVGLRSSAPITRSIYYFAIVELFRHRGQRPSSTQRSKTKMDILTGERSTKQKLEYRYLRTISELDRVTVPAGADEDLFPGVAEVSLPAMEPIVSQQG